jgi:hypothetical protein
MSWVTYKKNERMTREWWLDLRDQGYQFSKIWENKHMAREWWLDLRDQGYQFSKIRENRMHGKGVMIRFTRPGCQQNSLVLHTVQVQEWEAVILVIGSSNAMTEAIVNNNRSAKCQQLGHRLTGFPCIYQTSSCETWWAPCYRYSPTMTHGGCRYLKTDYQWT